MSDLPLSTSERNELEIAVPACSWLSERPRSLRRARSRLSRSRRSMAGDHRTPPRSIGLRRLPPCRGVAPPQLGAHLHRFDRARRAGLEGEADQEDEDAGEAE